MKVTIIIPVREINDYIRSAMKYYADLDMNDFEIIIFPDEKTDEHFPEMGGRVRIIPSGMVGPAEKRDMALEFANGEFIAFIDDDAYPSKRWLSAALTYFSDNTVGAVGGPAVTAPEDDIWQQGSGKVYESKMCSSSYTYRYLPEKKRDVDDLPSVNLIIRASLFRIIKGFDSNYYPGEDTKLCLDIINQGFRIVYDPEVLVYHHRRRLFAAHLKQATNYAKHRGYFAKVLPQTSRKFVYFIPSLFVIGLIVGPILSAFIPVIWYIYSTVVITYLILVGLSIHHAGSFKVWLLAFWGIIATHIGYGINFMRGILSKELLR